METYKRVCLNGLPPEVEEMTYVPPTLTRNIQTEDGKVREQHQDFYASYADIDFQNETVDVPWFATWRVHTYVIADELGDSTVGEITEEINWQTLKQEFPHYYGYWQPTEADDARG